MKRGLILFYIAVVMVLGCNLTSSPTPTAIPPTATNTSTPHVFIPTATITLMPSLTYTPTITLTPSLTLQTLTPSTTPSPHPPIAAPVCKTCQPYFRSSAGTTGKILKKLDATVTVMIIGRTADMSWAQATLPDGKQGWVSTHFLDLTGLDISVMPVTGAAVDASPTPTYAIGAPQVVTGVTSHSRDIFLKGKSMGNQANVFVKVGDSITASPMFLTSFGQGQYDLGNYPFLDSVVSFFLGGKAHNTNPFAAGSFAAGNGWGADRILQPGYSHPDVCGNDSPLVCEYKTAKPSVALILIGTNDAGGVDPAVFEGNLERIVQISIDMGVIPVLTTIPPKHLDAWNNQRIDQFNNIIRVVARQNDIPLLDYWYSLQKLPNQGIGSDGVHPSVPSDGQTSTLSEPDLDAGYTMHNLAALQMLDALWHDVLAY